MTILISFAALIATMVGGLFALRFRDQLHLILGFSAGAVIAVAFFDLMPESLDIGRLYFPTTLIPTVIAAGFFIYLVLDRTLFHHGHDHSEGHTGHGRSILGAGSLCVHSFLDGIAIGLSFQVSVSIGIVVAIAVLVHDFSDGINTVSLILRNGKEGHASIVHTSAFKWLVVDAIAPVLGVGVTMFFTLPEYALGIILALFCGFFFYIGASDLIPESHHRHPRALTTVMTIVGAGVLFVAIRIIG